MNIQSSLRTVRRILRQFPVSLAAAVIALSVLAPIARGQAPTTPAAPATASPVTINPDVTWGKWEGWGTSLCWWAKAFGDRDDLADVFFTTNQVQLQGQTLPGLGLNIVRYNAGACSSSVVNGHTIVLSPGIRKSRQMEGFWLDGASEDPDSKSWDWTVDANQRAMLLKARARGADRFELFSNSPMWWMCANDNPSGAALATVDNLPRENYDKFAVYMATIAKEAKEKWGITFTSVEPLNEPFTDFWAADGRQEGCHFSHEAQAEVIKLVRAEMDKRGLQDMPVAASDETHVDLAISTWYSFDKDVKNAVAKVNVHGYQGSGGRRDVLYDAVHKDGKELWNSEYGGAEPTGIQMAGHLDLDLRFLHPTAWVYWQVLDGGGWGFINGNNERKTVGAVSPKYYVMAQYSRHIRPGMTILDTGETNFVAAYDAAAKKLVIVALQKGAGPTRTIDLSKFAEAKGPITRWITEPKGASRYEMHQDIKLAGKSFDAAMPADSVQTFEIQNVTMN